MVYLLDELELGKLVQRVRNPDDRRSFLIHLTAEGQGTQRAAAIALADAADTLLQPLDPEERGLLRTLLTRIADHWQALSAARPG
jgi:DNA-binding MarR family transcriptional regulator